MAPLLGDWEDNKLRETDLTWKPTGWFTRLYNLVRHRKLYRFTTPFYNEYWFNMNEHYIHISSMQSQGLDFLIIEAADKSFERKFIKFLAGDDTDLTAMRLMK